MQEGNDPSLGVNSWLEEELYHQYQFDRKSVDEGWTDLFVHAESGNGNAAAIAPAPPAAQPAPPAVQPEPPPVQQEPPATPPAQVPPPTTEVAKAAPTQPAKRESKT